MLAGISRAHESLATGLIDATIEEFTAGGQGTAVQYARWARAVLLNGLGRYQEAMVAAQEASDDTPELFVSVWAAIELLEAASRCDEADLARHALDRIVAATAVAPGDWASGVAARSRALLSDGDSADPVPRGDRPAWPHSPPARARPRLSVVRRVAAPGESARRRTRAAPHCPRPVRRNRHAGLRRARPGRAAATGAGPQADGRDPRRADRAGVADRSARSGWTVESGDRCAAFPQPAHGGVASAQGVHQARDPLASTAGPSASRPGRRARPNLSSAVRRASSLSAGNAA